MTSQLVALRTAPLAEVLQVVASRPAGECIAVRLRGADEQALFSNERDLLARPVSRQEYDDMHQHAEHKYPRIMARELRRALSATEKAAYAREALRSVHLIALKPHDTLALFHADEWHFYVLAFSNSRYGLNEHTGAVGLLYFHLETKTQRFWVGKPALRRDDEALRGELVCEGQASFDGPYLSYEQALLEVKRLAQEHLDSQIDLAATSATSTPSAGRKSVTVRPV